MDWPSLVARRLEQLGFASVHGNTLVKRVDDLFHVAWIDAGGDRNVMLWVGVWAPEMQPGFAGKKFPKGFRTPLFGGVGMNQVHHAAGGWPWSPDQLVDPDCTSQMLAQVEQIAIPWLCAFADRGAVVEALDELGDRETAQRVGQCAGGGPALGLAPGHADELCASRRYQRVSHERFRQEFGRAAAKELVDRGFAAVKGDHNPQFYRHRSDSNIYDVIHFELIGLGTRTFVNLGSWVPEFDMAHRVDELPEDLMMINPQIAGPDDVVGYPKINRLCSVPLADDWLTEVLRRIDHVAMPWFDSIGSRQDIVTSASPDFAARLDDPIIGSITLRDMVMGKLDGG